MKLRIPRRALQKKTKKKKETREGKKETREKEEKRVFVCSVGCNNLMFAGTNVKKDCLVETSCSEFERFSPVDFQEAGSLSEVVAFPKASSL